MVPIPSKTQVSHNPHTFYHTPTFSLFGAVNPVTNHDAQALSVMSHLSGRYAKPLLGSKYRRPNWGSVNLLTASLMEATLAANCLLLSQLL